MPQFIHEQDERIAKAIAPLAKRLAKAESEIEALTLEATDRQGLLNRLSFVSSQLETLTSYINEHGRLP